MKNFDFTLHPSHLALEIARIFLNWYNVKDVYEADAETRMKDER
jgi:hypothetical protein